MKSFRRVYLFAALLLAGTVVLSVAIGSVFIPPADMLSMLLGKAAEITHDFEVVEE